MKIAVVFGTPSVEHLGSCVSGTHVADVLSKKHEVKRVLIDMNGEWTVTQKKFSYSDPKANKEFYSKAIDIGKPRWQTPDLATIKEIVKDVDIVLPLTHGPYGESGILQGFLETLAIPYAGPRTETCVLTQNKDLIKTLLKYHNITTPNFISFNKLDWASIQIDLLKSIKSSLKLPIFVKPNDGGSSIGISKVTNFDNIEYAIDDALRFCDRVIVEQGVDGYEVECAVIGSKDPIVAEKLGEIVSSNDFFDLESKYFKPSETYIPAKNISTELATKIKNMAKDIYKIARSTGFSRVDFMVDKKTKIPYMTEFTAIPGCTEYSLFPKLFVESGWKEIDLWEKIISYTQK